MHRFVGLLGVLVALLAASIVLPACTGYEMTSAPSSRSKKKKSTPKKTTTSDDAVEEESASVDDEESATDETTQPTEAETEAAEEPTPPPPPPPPTAGELAFPPLYASLEPTCGSCHRTGNANAPKFFGADAAATYPLFKARSFHLATSALKTKGIHGGPDASVRQRAEIDKWIAAEK